jgi:CCR4-NOT transcription complex subunit 6
MVLSLQVQADHYEQNLQPSLAEMGYDGLYKQKTRESMGQHGKVDGCAVFWKKSKFIMVENYTIEFNDIVKRNATQMGLEDSDLHRFISRNSKDNVAQVLVFEALVRPPQQQPQRSRTANRICVVNTHLYSNHTRPEIKLWQTATLLQEIEPFILNNDLALCICGDFNSEPESAVYQYLSSCRLDESNAKVEAETLKVCMLLLTPPRYLIIVIFFILCRTLPMWATED